MSAAANNASAQQRVYNSGIKYTVIKRPEAPESIEPEAGEQEQEEKRPTLYNRKIRTSSEPIATQAEAKQNTPETAANEPAETLENSALPKSPEQSAWDKYKELARGRVESEDDVPDVLLKPETPVTPETVKKRQHAEKEEKSPASLASIIADYKKNKDRRSQMRSITMSKPTRPETNKPVVETPSVKKDAPEEQ